MQIMTEAKQIEILDELKLTNLMLQSLSGAKPGEIEFKGGWAKVQEIVRMGIAPRIFAPGDMFVTPWTNRVTGQTYDFQWLVVHCGSVINEFGKKVPGMVLELNHEIPGVQMQYANKEGEIATETQALDGVFYYQEVEKNNTYTQLKLKTGDLVPPGTIHSSINDPSGRICIWGYERWGHSLIRMYLNSFNSNPEAWFQKMHVGQLPDRSSTRASRCGFLAGFEQDFLSVIQKTKIKTKLCFDENGHTIYEDTLDLMFVADRGELCDITEKESIPWDYYVEATGNGTSKAGRIKRDMNGQARQFFTRTPYIFNIEKRRDPKIYRRDKSGGFQDVYPLYEDYICPACVIC